MRILLKAGQLALFGPTTVHAHQRRIAGGAAVPVREHTRTHEAPALQRFEAALAAHREHAARRDQLLADIPTRGPGKAVHQFAAALAPGVRFPRSKWPALKSRTESVIDKAMGAGTLDYEAGGRMLDAVSATYRAAEADYLAGIESRNVPRAELGLVPPFDPEQAPSRWSPLHKGKAAGPHFEPCSCSKDCRKHAHWRVKGGDDEVVLRVPWEHRYDPHGWPADARRVTWKGPQGAGVGLVVAEGPDGVTATDGQRYHRIRHGEWKPHAPGAAAGAKPLRKAAEKKPIPKAGRRWITVRSSDDAEKGTPVLIEENKDGTHSVVGGAGGKLNHLRLTRVKDPGSEEAKKQAEEREAAKKEKDAAKKKVEGERQAKQTPEEKKQEGATRADLETAKLSRERKLIAKVRERLGGVSVDREEDFAQVERAKGKGVANRLRTALHRKQLREAQGRLEQAKRDLADHTVAEQSARLLIERTLEQQPEIAHEAKALAEESLAQEEAEEKERRAERAVARQRQPGGGNVGERARGVVEDKLAQLDPDRTERRLEQYGGRDDRKGFARTGDAEDEVRRRGLQAEHDGLQLARVASGEIQVDDLDRTARKELERVVDTGDDPEAIKVAALAAAARKFRRAEKETARADHLGTLDDPDAALRWADAGAAMIAGYAEAAKKLGLRDTEKEPLKAAEVEELVDLLKEEAGAKEAMAAFKKATEKIESGDYTGARDALTVRTDESKLGEAVQAGIADEVRTQLAQRVRRAGDQRDPTYLRAHALGQYDALAESALGVAGQRYLDRPIVDAVGSRNAAVLLRHALETDGHDPAKVAEALETHHTETQARRTEEALAKAEAILPGLEHKLDDAGSIEAALNDLDAHHLDIEDAQRAVGGALGRMEGLATAAWAMRQRQPDSLELGGPGVDLDTTLQWLHASGLREGDYSADYKRKVLTIPRASWDKLIRREDPKVVEARKVAREIKTGAHDEEGWLAPGIVSRTKSSFTDPLPDRALFREAPDFTGLDPKAEERDRLRWETGAAGRAVGGHERAVAAVKQVPGLERERDQLAAAGRLDEAETLTRRIAGIRRAGETSTGAIEGARTQHAEAQRAHGAHIETHGDLGTARSVDSALRDHVASRLADGEPAPEIASDLLTPAAVGGVPPEHRESYSRAVRSIFPLADETGQQQRIEASAGEHRRMVHDWAARRYGPETAHFHAQDLRVDDPKTHEAIWRALTEHPAAAAAFKPGGEMGPADRAALRAHIEKKLAAAEGERGGTALTKALEALGPEPEQTIRGQGGLFGAGSDTKNPDWIAWKKHRDAALEEHGGEGVGKTGWAKYVQTHGDREAALHAARDDLRGDYLASFHGHWSRLHGQPLIAGSTIVHGAEKHALALGDPTRAEAMRARQDQIRDALRERQRETSGRFGAGSFGADLERQLQTETVHEQAQAGLFGAQAPAETPRARALRELGAEPQKHDPNQRSMFGPGEPTDEWKEWSTRRKAVDAEHPEGAAAPAGAPPARERVKAGLPEVGAGERITLGHLAEEQIASTLPRFAEGLDPRKQGVNLAKITGLRQDGAFIHHQRVVKMNLAVARTGAWLQTGSGKSLVSLSAFTAHHDAGNAKHGLFLTPAGVRDQFGAEIARFTAPGKYRYATSEGKDHAARVAMLADPETHMRVMTHEAFRETVTKMVADHHFKGDQKQAIEALAGKDASDASILSSVVRGWAHPTNSPQMLLGTATPHKNDEQEVASMAALLDPERYGTPQDTERARLIREAADAHGIPPHFTYLDEAHKATTRTGDLQATVQANIGGHLPGSRDSMRAELDHLTYMAGTKPDVRRTDTSNPVIDPETGEKHSGPALALTPWQQEQSQGVMDAYDRVRTSRGSVEDVKTLSPARFEGRPEAEHEEIAKALHGHAIHLVRDHALSRVLDGAPAEHNAKVQAMTRILHHDQARGRRSAIFSDSVQELTALKAHLEAQGFKVGLRTGGPESTPDFMARANPERGAPEFDVALLSPAGEAGLNLQPFSVLHHYDVPRHQQSATQRAGRIHRTGQTADVEVHTWAHDHEHEHAALRRLRRKADLSEAFESATPLLDDTGIAAYYEHVLQAKHKAAVAPGAVA